MAGNELAIRAQTLARLEIEPVNSGASFGPWIDEPGGEELISFDPSEGTPIAKVRMAVEEDYDDVLYEAAKAFEKWRMFPAPKRGAIVREIGDELRKYKQDLGTLVSLEMGKSLQEGLGEVQEMIDVAGLRRRPLTPAPRPHHAQRTPTPPHVRTVAPARHSRRNQRLQLSGSRLVLERPDRSRLRRRHRLEALPRNAAHRHRRAENLQPRNGPPRLDRRLQPADRRSGNHRRAPVKGPPHPVNQRHRLHRHGPPRSGSSGPSPGPDAAGTRRQQRRNHHAGREPGPGPPGCRLRRIGNGRSAMHHTPPPVPAQKHRPAIHRTAHRGLQERKGRIATGPHTCWARW